MLFDWKLGNTNIRAGGRGDKVKERVVSISHLFTAIFKVVHY